MSAEQASAAAVQGFNELMEQYDPAQANLSPWATPRPSNGGSRLPNIQVSRSPSEVSAASPPTQMPKLNFGRGRIGESSSDDVIAPLPRRNNTRKAALRGNPGTPALAALQPSHGVLNPAFSPGRLNYSLLVPASLEGLQIQAACANPEEMHCTVDKHDPSTAVHILPNTPSQHIIVEVQGNNRRKTVYTVDVLQVSDEDWAGWQGGFEYPSSSPHAPTARYFPVGGAGFAPDDIDPADLHVVNTKFSATCDEEQSLVIGQTIIVVAKADTGWWAGFIWSASAEESAGWFPEGCVSPQNGPACQRRSHYGGTPSPSPTHAPPTPMSLAMNRMGGGLSRFKAVPNQQRFLQSSMRSIRSDRSVGASSNRSLDFSTDDYVGEYLGALDQMTPGQLAELENQLGETMAYERPPSRMVLPGVTEDAVDDDDSYSSGSAEDGSLNASGYGGMPNVAKSARKKNKKKRRRRRREKGKNKVSPGAGEYGPPDVPEEPARHRSPHLPICSCLFGVVWIIMWIVQVGKFGFAKPSENIFLGAGWSGQRAMGAVWPNDLATRDHYHRLLTALFNPIGFFRLLFDLVALRMFGCRIEKIHGPATFAFVFLFGGFGGHGLEAILAPAWLTTGASPGLVALYIAMLVDIVSQRKKHAGAVIDAAVVMGFVVWTFLLAGMPGSGVWAAFGGALFGWVAKMVAHCASKTQAKCKNPKAWWAGLVFFVLACAGLIAGVVLLLTSAEERQICTSCMEACYDVACWCDPTRRLAVNATAAFTPDQIAFFKSSSLAATA